MPEISPNITAFFHANKNIAYHIAYDYTKDEPTAEAVVEDVMRTMRTAGFLEGTYSDDEQRGLLALITRHRALVAARARSGGVPPSDEASLPMPVLVGDADVSLFGEWINQVPTRDRIVLLLARIFDLSDAKIAKVLRLKPQSVTKRRSRCLQFMTDRMREARGDAERLEENPAFLTALALWLKSRMQSIEARAAIDPHVYSTTTEERMLALMSDPHRERAFRALHASGSRLPLLLGGFVLVVIIIFAIIKAIDTNHGLGKNGTTAIVSSETAPPAETEPVITETREIPPSHYAFYADRMVFFDGESGMLYRVKNGGTPEKLLDIGKAVDDGMGLQYIGDRDDTIYLAFIDGKGGRIEGQPAMLKLDQYWQSNWFANQLTSVPVQRVIVDTTAFTFRAQ